MHKSRWSQLSQAGGLSQNDHLPECVHILPTKPVMANNLHMVKFMPSEASAVPENHPAVENGRLHWLTGAQ